MVLTDKQKAVIENDFNEKGWNAYKIWKEHPSFECSHMAVYNLIKKIKENASTERCKRGGRPVPTTTEENASIFEDLDCTQEDELVPKIPSRKSHLGNQSANHQFIAWSRKRIFIATNVFKHLKLIHHAIREGAEYAGKLLQRFSIIS